jgi:HAD superfamily hydrolase (TIGR01509 family)
LPTTIIFAARHKVAITGIIFDLYDTLAHFDLSALDLFRQHIAQEMGVSLRDFKKSWKKFFIERCKGEIPGMVRMMQVIAADLGVDAGRLDFEELARMEKEGIMASTRPYLGVDRMIERLKGRGYRLGLLSNASENVEYVVDRLPWMKYFDQIVLSYQAGVMKPDPSIFRLALEKMRLSPGECLYVGDGGSMELDGAMEVGMTTVKVVQPNQEADQKRSGRCDYLIDSITRLPALLEGLSGGPSATLDEGEAEKLWEMLNQKDSFTASHSRRVSDMLEKFARGMDWPEEDANSLKISGLLHDLGKIELPDGIFSKLHNGEDLHEDELEMIKKHAGYTGYLENYRDLPGIVTDCLRYHHERFDGTGYPCGIGGQEIPLSVRMLSIADFYDTVVYQRAWKTPELQRPLGKKDALLLLIDESATRFDPEIVKLFIRIVLEEGTGPAKPGSF